MEMRYSSIAASCIVVLLTYVAYSLFNWVWLRPKKLEKCLRDQGFRGNPYRLFVGDQKESSMMIRDAKSRPIGINDDVKQRVMPHILKTINNHGKKSYMWIGRMPRIFIMEPKLVTEILNNIDSFQKNFQALDPLTKFLFTGVGALEGKQWAKHRRVVNAAFRLEKLKLMLPAFHLACLDMVNKWEKMISPEGSTDIDVFHDFNILSGDVFSRTLFGNSYKENERAFDLMQELIVLTTEVIHSVYIPGWRFLPTKRNNRMKRINKEIVAAIKEIMKKKMKAVQEGESQHEDNFLGILLGAGMSTKEIIDECKLFYLAGQDTTSTLFGWAMVLLCKHPEWQARAREEVVEVFGDKTPDHDGITRLKIVTMILYEVLRLYPPIMELTKFALEETKLGELTIPSGVEVMIPSIILHHDPEIWGDDVMEFKPERFSEGMLKATKRLGSFVPFGLGPRMCIGQNFVLLEAKMALALILQRFSFEFSPSYVHAPLAFVTMQPQYGVPLILHKL